MVIVDSPKKLKKANDEKLKTSQSPCLLGINWSNYPDFNILLTQHIRCKVVLVEKQSDELSIGLMVVLSLIAG